MKVIIALIVTFFVGFTFKVKGSSPNKALAYASLLMPSYILISEFILPPDAGSTSMWPIALLFGTIYGTIIGGLGVVAGGYYLTWKLRNSGKSE